MELQTKQLVMAIKQIAEEKNLPEDVVQDVIEQALAAAYRKDFGDKEQDVRSTINFNTGEVTVYVSKEITETVEDEHLQVSLADAQQFKKDAKVGDMIEILSKPETFGRVAAQTAKQVILQKLRESEREIILNEYQDKIGQVLNAVVQRVESRVVRVDLGKATGILPQSEQIQGEYYSPGNRIKVYLKEVERTNRGPQLILSRANTDFIEYLFRNEVPEMENGAVEIKAIAREAGVRTKLAVASSVPGVDPVGTFVGGHGTRVQAVMSEIGDREKIDIITFDEDPIKFITAALSPTEVGKVEIDKKANKAVVKVAEDQLSIAIGKHGQNVRLASKLTGYEIDIEGLGGSKNKSKSEADKKEVETKAPAKSEKSRPKRKSELEEALLSAIDEHGDDAVEPTENDKSKGDSPKSEIKK
jgi:N utilization substance protein A